MRIFDYSSLASRSWNSEIIGLVAQIHEYKGRQELFLKQKPAERSTFYTRSDAE